MKITGGNPFIMSSSYRYDHTLMFIISAPLIACKLLSKKQIFITFAIIKIKSYGI